MSSITDTAKPAGRAWVLCVDPGTGRSAASRLEEAAGLARAIDLDVIAAESVVLRRPRPATLIGRGKVDELAGRLKDDDATLVIVDAALTPIQQRNLERAWDCKVIDRTGLILEIFGERARTREGVLQVELAALSYQRSRLVRSWTHLERQRGGFGFVGGPGESQIEMDRRRIDERITRIKRDLDTVRRTRGLHRGARRRVPYPVIALVGYTNAGKSTLFNRLTGADVVARDQLFATLDPTMRAVRLPSGRNVILSDTVGFISDLPTSLVAAFRATLEEVIESDLVLHIRDIAHFESDVQCEDVTRVLTELGIGGSETGPPMLEVWNKSDLLGNENREILHNEAARRDDDVVLMSAQTGEGCERLLSMIDERVRDRREIVDLCVPASNGALLAWLYRHGDILERRDSEDCHHLTVALAKQDLGQLRKRDPAMGQPRHH